MNIVNETPFTFAPLSGKVVYPRHTVSLIVKGTFHLASGQAMQPAQAGDQLPPSGDLYYDNDPQTSVRYESDFAYFKPRADILVVGNCHCTENQTRTACPVRIQAGTVSKALMVYGKRSWVRSSLGMWQMSDPEPFRNMAIRYENSYGGKGYERNPVGKGIKRNIQEKGHTGDSLPNLRVLEGEQLETMHAGIPAGFGPLGRTWPQRRELAGTYGDKWLQERWPWLPEDFDWGYYNAAPPDQQVKGYLQGDEELVFENLHSEHTTLKTSLPGIRVRLFLSEKKNSEHLFREVNTSLDTLWVDLDAGLAVLVWRGLATVDTPEYKEVEDLLIVSESTAEKSRPIEAYQQLLMDRKIQPGPVDVEPEITQDGDHQSPAHAAADGLDADQAEPDAAIAQGMEQVHAVLDHSGLDAGLVMALKAEKDPGQLVAKFVQGLAVDPVVVEKIRAQSREQTKLLLVEHGYDPGLLDELDAQTASVQAPPRPGRQELAAAARSPEGFAGLDLMGADFCGLQLEQADFKGAGLKGARFAKAQLAGADFTAADLQGADFRQADLTGAIFMEADLKAALFFGANLSGANLTGAVLSEAVLCEADLKEANLSRADLSRSDFSQADLQKALLEETDFTGADLSQADMQGAQLSYAVLEGADLTKTNMAQIDGSHAIFRGGNLLETDFSSAILVEADFSGCRCDLANFQCADLSRATLEGLVGRQVNFRSAVLLEIHAGEKAVLPQGSFRRARGSHGNWAGADLQGADFILSEMIACDFSHADLSGADCRTAELKRSVFDKAILKNAQFNRANLFQVRLEQADLTGTNFKGSNLYGAEFLNASISKKTIFRGANLKGTKLVHF